MLGSISFLTTLPFKGDVEKLRRNLWTFTYTAIFIGLVIAVPDFVRRYAGIDLRFLAVVLYVAIEGINHIDGLIDFGDALFAPENRKREALKDTNTGVGGIATATIYFLLLYHILQLSDAFQIIFSQTVAKFSMLLLMVISKPCWEGMGSYMMEFAGYRDLILAVPPLLVVGYMAGMNSVFAFILALAVVLMLRSYSEKKFGGVSGDIIGATNCITFVSSLILLKFSSF